MAENKCGIGTLENGIDPAQDDPSEGSISTGPGSMIINPKAEDEMEVFGYALSVARVLLTLALVLGSCGLWGLPLYWLPHLLLYSTHSRCRLSQATSILAVTTNTQGSRKRFVKKVHNLNNAKEKLCCRFFMLKKHKYLWEQSRNAFVKCQGLDFDITLNQLQSYSLGLSSEEAARLRVGRYGKNEINVPLNSIPTLLIKEILTPFYVFQIFSMILWYTDQYIYYASALLIISVISLTAVLYSTRKNQRNLKKNTDMVESVTVFRPDGTSELILSTDLVPGDVIEIPDFGSKMFCDAILLEGQAIMNESMLTGESVPITKTNCAMEDVKYNSVEHDKHTLKCGTEVIQTRKFNNQKVKAVVVRTGYLTAKGDLIRSILYPQPSDFKFETDSYKFIGVMAVIATIGMTYTLIKMIIDEEAYDDILLEVLDLITIVVPPALPAAMTIGVIIAQNRLKKRNIFCISPRKINVAGSVDCVCFDKTGTITEDGMDMWGVIPTFQGITSSFIPDPTKVSKFSEAIVDLTTISTDSLMQVGMAVCHELSRINGVIMGDPLDEKIFESTRWTIENEHEDHVDPLVMNFMRSPELKHNPQLEAAPQRIFPFSSDKQCMSVVCRVVKTLESGTTQTEGFVFCKGSPEKIRNICNSASIPQDFDTKLNYYASNGYRVLALAAKQLSTEMDKTVKINKMTRTETESDLNLLGLIVLENRLKAVSGQVIKELLGANIRPVMVTGDNILTAVCVAQNCGIIPSNGKVLRLDGSIGQDGPVLGYEIVSGCHKTTKPIKKAVDFQLIMDNEVEHCYLALDGKTFEIICHYFQYDILPYVATSGAVFARMKPDMKQKLVEILSDLEYYVAMCGDGANDCGALKAAHVGISLSEAEASVASPFTSKTPDISCVPELVKEGRAALVTSFGIFKYMAGYSIIQFASVMILYEFYSNLSDTQYLYIDLFVITSLASTFGLDKIYKGPLAKTPPLNSLIAPLPLFSLISQLSIIIAFQFAALFLTMKQDWYVEFDYENSCYLNTSAEQDFSNQGLDTMEKCEAESDPVASYENYAMFSVSQFQYILLAFVFAKGHPYREGFWKNWSLMATMMILVAFSLYLTINPTGVFIYAELIGFELFLPPMEHFNFRLYMLALVGGNIVVAFFCEIVLADRLIPHCLTKKKTKYNKIEDEMAANGNLWATKFGLGTKNKNFPPENMTDGDSVHITDMNMITSEQAFEAILLDPNEKFPRQTFSKPNSENMEYPGKTGYSERIQRDEDVPGEDIAKEKIITKEMSKT